MNIWKHVCMFSTSIIEYVLIDDKKQLALGKLSVLLWFCVSNAAECIYCNEMNIFI